MKKIIIAVFAILGMSTIVHAVPPIRYVQISTGSLTRQTGTAVVAGVNASTITASSATFSGGADFVNQKLLNLSSGTLDTDAARYSQIFYGFQAPVQATTATSFTTTATTWTTTNLTANFTPTDATHRVKITAVGGLVLFNGTSTVTASIFRGNTNLASIDAGFAVFVASAPGSSVSIGPTSMTWTDTPLTNAVTTYAVKIYSSGGATVQFGQTRQVMTLEEIK